ncbi:MAG: tripartite tricarboxylate transporter substrate binding protein, partial [Oxalobacteraceae bacterium]
KIRALAVTSAERAEMLPEVPTMAESGFAGFDVQAWGGIMGPAKMPAAVTGRLNRELNEALNDPAVRRSMRESGSVPQGGSSTDFGAFVVRESAAWKRVIDASGIKVD